MKVTLLNSLTRSEPVVDKDDKPVMAKKKFYGREQEFQVHEHAFHPAHTVLDLDDTEAKGLIKKGYARKMDPALDVDPEDGESDGDGDGEMAGEQEQEQRAQGSKPALKSLPPRRPLAPPPPSAPASAGSGAGSEDPLA